MNKHPVKSSRIASIGYDAGVRELEIQFKDGQLWRYRNVPEKTFHTFLTVVSKGRFYDGVIRNKFAAQRLR
jgi:hypothetical protein